MVLTNGENEAGKDAVAAALRRVALAPPARAGARGRPGARGAAPRGRARGTGGGSHAETPSQIETSRLYTRRYDTPRGYRASAR